MNNNEHKSEINSEGYRKKKRVIAVVEKRRDKKTVWL